MTSWEWVLQVLIGLSFGLLLFLLAAGLSLIFGLMRFVNLAHGALFLAAAYVATDLAADGAPFALVVAGAIGVAAALGLAIYLVWMAGGDHYKDPLWQVLLTFGVVLVVGDVTRSIWGGESQATPTPSFLQGSIDIGDAGAFPIYRFAIIGVALTVGGLLWLVQARTRFGALVRAGVDDEDMVHALGVDTRLLFGATFVIGAALAGLAGGMGSVVVGAYAGADFDVLVLALVVVVLGGLGSLQGAFVASVGVGVADSLGKALFPELAPFSIMALVVATLAFRPQGLFGAR